MNSLCFDWKRDSHRLQQALTSNDEANFENHATFLLPSTNLLNCMEPPSPHPNSGFSYAHPSKQLSLKFGKVFQSIKQVASIITFTTKMHIKKIKKYDTLVLGFRRQTNWWKFWPIYISKEDASFRVFKTKRVWNSQNLLFWF